ncbi:MAG: ferritin family protein [Candidatus Krumholzibacteriota bacterium]|nr:ferritin family protein [Candidatus Krumholzibacteriota bacterium]
MSRDAKQPRFDTIDAVFDFAVEKEEEAAAFYREWADRVAHEAIRRVFAEFAGEEEKHRAKLVAAREGASTIHEGGRVPDLRLADHFVDVEPHPDMSYGDALRVAIAREKAAHDMYLDLAAAWSSTRFAGLFADLAEEEAGHKLKLETIYDDTFLKEG